MVKSLYETPPHHHNPANSPPNIARLRTGAKGMFLHTCCEDNIVELIQSSKNSIDMAIYAFTNQKIYEALKEAKGKGISIKIVTDKTQSKGKISFVPAFIHDGFDVRIKKKYRIEHNKFGIFDGKTVITGSYNWTESATRNNSENCLVGESSGG